MGGNRQTPFALKPAGEGNPLPIYKFWVEIESIIVAQFQDCSGLKVERSVERIEEGGVNDHEHILPGRSKYSNITLKYGMSNSKEIWNWFQEGLLDGKVKRINFSILLRDVKGDVARRWNVVDAFPVRWEGPQFTSDSNQAAIETLEIAHHGITAG
jgi:phage tail-like protein